SDLQYHPIPKILWVDARVVRLHRCRDGWLIPALYVYYCVNAELRQSQLSAVSESEVIFPMKTDNGQFPFRKTAPGNFRSARNRKGIIVPIGLIVPENILARYKPRANRAVRHGPVEPGRTVYYSCGEKRVAFSSQTNFNLVIAYN